MRESVGFEGLQRGGVTAGRNVLLLTSLVLLALGAGNSVSCVRTGHVGVVTMCGRVTGRTMPEGMVVGNSKTGLPLLFSGERQ